MMESLELTRFSESTPTTRTQASGTCEMREMRQSWKYRCPKGVEKSGENTLARGFFSRRFRNMESIGWFALSR